MFISFAASPIAARLGISDTLGLAALRAPFLESTPRDRDRSSGRGIQVRGSERRVPFPKIWILGRIGRPNLFFFGHELIRGALACFISLWNFEIGWVCVRVIAASCSLRVSSSSGFFLYNLLHFVVRMSGEHWIAVGTRKNLNFYCWILFTMKPLFF